MEGLLFIIVVYGGLYLIGFIWNSVKESSKKRREEIRNQVLQEIEKDTNVQEMIKSYKERLAYIKTDNSSNFYEEILRNNDVKQIGQYGNFLGDCPECKKGNQVVRKGRYGNFIGCSRYPNCKYTKNLNEFKKSYKIKINKQIMDDLQKAYS